MQHGALTTAVIGACAVMVLGSGIAAAAVVSLPSNVTIAAGEAIGLDVTIDDATGLEAAEIRVDYDSSVVTAASVSQDPLISACPAATNIMSTQVAMSFACAGTLSGSGAMFTINISGGPTGGTTALTITTCRLNEGNLACTPQSGDVTVLAPTPTPTSTTTPTATATASPAPPALNLGTGVGRPGGIACLPAVLSYTGAGVASTSNDIGFDTAQFTLNSCTINPTIGPSSAIAKTQTLTPLGAGAERIAVGGNANVIPAGVLYSCTFAVSAGASTGVSAVTNSPSAADTSGSDIAGVTGSAGQVRVTTCTGDCDGNGVVTIGEIIKCVNLFLGQPLCNPGTPTASCPVADVNLNGSVSIGEVTQCINHFLGGC